MFVLTSSLLLADFCWDVLLLLPLVLKIRNNLEKQLSSYYAGAWNKILHESLDLKHFKAYSVRQRSGGRGQR